MAWHGNHNHHSLGSGMLNTVDRHITKHSSTSVWWDGWSEVRIVTKARDWIVVPCMSGTSVTMVQALYDTPEKHNPGNISISSCLG